MRLTTFDDDRIGVVTDNHITDISDLVEPSPGVSRMRRFIAAPRLDLAAVAVRERPSRLLAEVELRAPVPDPGAIVAAPVNYQDHREEMKETGDVSALGFFLKSPTSVLGHGGTIRLPYDDRRFDHEAEVAIVIGRETRNVSETKALDHVFGYTGLLDVTMRGGEDRSIRKSFDTFTPFGPWVVTPDEFGDPTDVDFSLTTNGQGRQKSNTSDLIWGVARFVAYVSSVMTLRPGDVVSTGTPAGVSPIEDGDTVRLSVDRVGDLVVTVSSAGATPSVTRGHTAGPVPPPAR